MNDGERKENMEHYYELTDTELELMEVFWEAEEPLCFKDLMKHSNELLNKNWKKQTLSTYLKHLQNEGMIEAGKSVGSAYLSYYPLVTKDEFMQSWTRNVVNKSFGNSLGNFIAAFTGGNKLSEEDAEELKKYL